MSAPAQPEATEAPKLRPLNARQALFVVEYLVDLNATQAATRAGYSPRTAEQLGYQLLQNPSVRAAIDAAMVERSKRVLVTADRVLEELAKIGFSDIRRAVRWGSRFVERPPEEGDRFEEQAHGGALKRPGKAPGEEDAAFVTTVELVDSGALDDATAAAISEVAQTKEGVRIKLHDKKGALVDIGRHLGMFKDKVEHSGPGGGPIVQEFRWATSEAEAIQDPSRKP